MSIRKKIKTFYSLSSNRKFLFFFVVVLSIYQKTLLFLRSKKAFTESLINKKFQFEDLEFSYKKKGEVLDIEIAIGLGKKYIPWKNLCRHQAWQAVVLLNRARIPFTYHVGLKKNDPNKGEGHAWVMVNGRFVSGKCRLSDYYEIKFK